MFGAEPQVPVAGRADFAATEMFLSSQLSAEPGTGEPVPDGSAEPSPVADFDPTAMFEPSQQPAWDAAAAAQPPLLEPDVPEPVAAEEPAAMEPAALAPAAPVVEFQPTATFADSPPTPDEAAEVTGEDSPKKKVGTDYSSSDLLDFDFGETVSPEPPGKAPQTDIETEPGVLDAPATDAGSLTESPDEQVKVIGDLRIGIPLYNVYLNEADEWSRRLLTELSEWALEIDRPMPDSTVGLAHALAGSSATVGFMAVADLARLLERALLHVQLHQVGLPEHAQTFNRAAEEIRRLLHQFAAGFLKDADPAVAPALHAVAQADLASAQPRDTPAQVGAGTTAGAAPLIVASDDHSDAVDALDADLFPIFEEEATELFPRLGAALRQWLDRPDDRAARTEALRVLHTLKGSARLAGAMRLGDLAHRMESAIEALGSEAVPAGRVEPMLGRFDSLRSLFDGLCAFARRRKDAPPEAAVQNPAGTVMVDVATADTRQGPRRPWAARARPLHRRGRAGARRDVAERAGRRAVARSSCQPSRRGDHHPLAPGWPGGPDARLAEGPDRQPGPAARTAA